MKTVISNLRRVKANEARFLERGLVKAGLFLQRESQKVVPIDTGALKNSAFTRKVGKGFDAKVFVGYTVVYAIYVHENLNARHAPGKIAKFLEKPARDNRRRIQKIIADELRKANK